MTGGGRIRDLVDGPASAGTTRGTWGRGIDSPAGSIWMSNLPPSATIRRIGSRVEMHATLAPAGRSPRVLGEDDLLLLVDHPSARVRCGSRIDRIPPVLLSVVGGGEVVVLEIDDAAPTRALYLAPGFVAETLRTSHGWDFGASDDRRIVCVAAGARLCEEADRIDSEEGVGRLVASVLVPERCRVRRVADERAPHAVIARVREHLRASYTRRVTLDDMARLAGMGRYSLARAFTREVGIPPHSYQTHLRIQRARTLIGAGRRLSDVSLEVGFTDQSHLNRHFKRVVGVTPGLYARTALPSPVRGQRIACGDGPWRCDRDHPERDAADDFVVAPSLPVPAEPA